METVYSVLEQTHFHFELIIVDDGSTDRSEEIIQPCLKDRRVQYHKIANSERGAARNFGTKKSSGEYVTFLDSDDIFLPWHLLTAEEKITSNNRPPVFHLAYEVLQPHGKVLTSAPLPNPVNDKLIEGNFLSCMGVFLRRDIALEYLFDENRQLSGSEDYELWLRIAAQISIVVFPEVTSRLINHGDRSVVKMDNSKLINRIRLLESKLKGNRHFVARFGNHINMFSSYNALYLSLHLAMSGSRLVAAKKLLYAVKQYPAVIASYRFAVVVKKILLW